MMLPVGILLDHETMGIFQRYVSLPEGWEPPTFRIPKLVTRIMTFPWRIHGTDIFTHMKGWFYGTKNGGI